MTTLRPASALLLAAAALGAAAVGAETDGYTIVNPGDLTWSDVPSLPPGAKIALIEGKMSEAVPITARLKLPANYKLPPHWHPAVERVTVLAGTFNYGMGTTLDMTKTMPLGPGALVIMPPKMNHYVWTKDETIIQLNVIGPWGITYVNPADDPRKK